jgi:hypothetical protein
LTLPTICFLIFDIAANRFNTCSALVWGSSVKHKPQRVGKVYIRPILMWHLLSLVLDSGTDSENVPAGA